MGVAICPPSSASTEHSGDAAAQRSNDLASLQKIVGGLSQLYGGLHACTLAGQIGL